MTPFQKPWGNYLLDGIVETQPPEAISWFPQAVGWQLLLMVLFLLAIQKIYSSWQAYKKNKYRREALHWLQQFCVSDEHAQQENIRQLPVLIRKTAMAAFGRVATVSLIGEDWDKWLDERCSHSNFSTQCPKVLYQLAYAPKIDLNENQLTELLSQLKLWVTYHDDHINSENSDRDSNSDIETGSGEHNG
jgi:hypothetical protein